MNEEIKFLPVGTNGSMIQLHVVDGSHFWIRACHIASLHPDRYGCAVLYDASGQRYVVQHAVDEVLRAMAEAEK